MKPTLERRWWMHVVAAMWTLLTVLLTMYSFRELGPFWNGAICGAAIAVVYPSVLYILAVALWAHQNKNQDRYD